MAQGSVLSVHAVDWYDGWMVSRVSEVRYHLNLLTTNTMCHLGSSENVHESIEGAMPVKGAVEGGGLSARRDTTMVHSVLQ